MRESDFQAFAQLLDDVWQLKGQSLLPGAKGQFFCALAMYPLQLVHAALDAHVADPVAGKFLPMPADVIAKLQARAGEDGRPTADEAWATALLAADERETVVWTAETAEAFAIARSVLDAGDDVGARMAFRAAYDRLVGVARREARRVEWMASLGADPERRALALEAAAKAGRATAQHLSLAIDRPREALLLANPEAAAALGAPPEAVAALRDLRDRLRHGGVERASVDAAARADTQRRQQEARQRIADAVPDAGLESGPWMTPSVAGDMLQRVRNGGRP